MRKTRKSQTICGHNVCRMRTHANTSLKACARTRFMCGRACIADAHANTQALTCNIKTEDYPRIFGSRNERSGAVVRKLCRYARVRRCEICLGAMALDNARSRYCCSCCLLTLVDADATGGRRWRDGKWCGVGFRMQHHLLCECVCNRSTACNRFARRRN